jgi:hemoglobin/transferrin/lactoferrin receptor protein
VVHRLRTYAEGYRAPALTEVFVSGTHPQPAPFILVPNLGLKPEVGKTKEIGQFPLRQPVRRQRCLAYQGERFQNDLTDFIEQTSLNQNDQFKVGDVSSLFGCVQYQNVPSARIRGSSSKATTTPAHGSWGGGLAPGGR